MYRTSPDDPAGTGDLVDADTFMTTIDAQLAHTSLAAQGVTSHVVEAASFNPMLNGAVGGTRLMVREGDLHRARAILRANRGAGPIDDGEGEGVVRCPRCELAYCANERLNLQGSSAAAAAGGLAILAAPVLFFIPKRWRCHKCGHAWDDPNAGPREMTKLEPDDPHPVFRLRRAYTGLGGVLGFILGMCVASMAMKPLGMIAWTFVFVGAAVGAILARVNAHDVCSEPGCRAPLAPAHEHCPGCDGAIAGLVQTSEEHYSAAADFRRELAAEHASARSQKKKKRKRPALVK